MTDTDGEVRYDPAAKPGLSNLLELLAVATGRTPEEAAGDYERYGDLKADVAEALVELLRPVRERRRGPGRRPGRGPGHAGHRGRRRPRSVASATYARSAEAIGLLSPG